MDEAALLRAVRETAVFARVSPAHKLRIAQAWQATGAIVAMTGDGVNDAPALKQADIGIAMGISGTDVSREAAAMTLTDDNFASIVAAVEEGRGVFDNIRKYLTYLLSSNIGEIGLMAVATLAGLPLPLAAVQLLYVNLATDGLPAMALAVDPPEPGLMERPPRDPKGGVFPAPVVVLMLLGGAWSTVVNASLFAWSLRDAGGLPHAMSMCFVSLVLIQLVKAYSFRSDRESVFRRPFANRWLNLAVGWELLMLVALVSVAPLRGLFGLVPLEMNDWLLAAGAALTMVPVLEAGKWGVRRALLPNGG
jgi:Ca2+-transporting ATPase